MPTFPDYSNFAFSFSHAVIRVDNFVYTAVENIRLSQRLQEGAVYGTARGPLKRSAGQLELGQGTLVFSDMSEAFNLIQALSPDFMFRVFDIDYTLVNESLETRSIELRSCRFTGLDIDHAQGPDALPAEFPFSFLQMRVNGNEIAIAIAGIAQAVSAVVKLF
jgi:hypothetical protein